MDFNMNKTVLITGVSRGIGKSLAEKFISHGYSVVGGSRSTTAISFSEQNFKHFQLDLTDDQSIQTFVEAIDKQNLQFDFIINNAAIGPDLGQTELKREWLESTLQVNLIGTILLTEKILGYLKKDGTLVNITSKLGSINALASSRSPAYRISKTGLNMYAKVLSDRISQKQKIVSIHPGWVKTSIDGDSTSGNLSTEESARRIYEYITSDFPNGIFWDVEGYSELGW